MSFGASYKRALDPAKPVGLRVACLIQCAYQVGPWGLTGTMERLRAMTGAGPRWSGDEVAEAARLVRELRDSLDAFRVRAQAEDRAAKRAGRRGRDPLELREDWFAEWLASEASRPWREADVAVSGR